MIHINETHLTAREERQARYLAAVAEFREAEAQYVAGETTDSRHVLDLASKVSEYDDIDARSLPLPAAAAKYNVPAITLRVACQNDELRCYKRPSPAGGRMVWWIEDDETLSALALRAGHSKRGRPRRAK